MNNTHSTKRYHFLYRTTNLINNKIYIGVHSTDDVFDGYLGSGNLLKLAVKKYGKGQFYREVLRYTDTREESYILESVNVNDVFVNRVDTYNLCVGGYGNRSSVNGKNNPMFGRHHSEETKLKISKSNSGENSIWFGRYHSEETKSKMSRSAVGRKHTDESKQKISISSTGKSWTQPKVTCPYCGKVGGLSPMNRYHFDNCLNNPNSKPRQKTKPYTQPKVTCPYCGKVGGKGLMRRYHFDNCKSK